jgi:hypothetical protein
LRLQRQEKIDQRVPMKRLRHGANATGLDPNEI